jgi:hypothetical protein
VQQNKKTTLKHKTMVTDKDIKLIPHFYHAKTWSSGMILEIKTDSTTINIIRGQASLYETADDISIVGRHNGFKGEIKLSKNQKKIYITTF